MRRFRVLKASDPVPCVVLGLRVQGRCRIRCRVVVGVCFTMSRLTGLRSSAPLGPVVDLSVDRTLSRRDCVVAMTDGVGGALDFRR